MKSIILLFSFLSSFAFADVHHGVSLELNRGVGYSLAAGKLWTGFNFGAYQMRGSGPNEPVVITPRIFLNYDIFEMSSIPVFAGVSWAEDYGLRDDTKINKRRVAEHLELAGWMNLFAGYERFTYDSATDARYYDPSYAKRTFFEFGGVSGTYFF